MRQAELGKGGVTAAVVRTYEAVGCIVIRIPQSYRRGDQRRSPGTPGIPDLYVFPPVGHPTARNHTPWWHESKAEDGKPRPRQKEFELRCRARGVDCVLGGVPEAIGQLQRRGFVI